ncbi:MAG TPA: ABC transporter permease [Bryobacteraceae bacterium]
MRTVRRFVRRLGAWRRRSQDEARLSAEIDNHIALQTAENLKAGLSPDEARRQAVLKFGAVEAMKEGYRDQRGLPFLETLMQDTRHAVRRLRKAPAFTITTILTLALGIGATTSIFTLVHAVLLKSLAVANPSDLYRLGRQTHCCMWGGYSQDAEYSLVSYELYQHFRDNTKGFAELAGFQAGGGGSLFGVRRASDTEAAQSHRGEFVSGNYFAMFGVRAFAGRSLAARDDQPTAPPVAVMSYRLWQQKYGTDPSIIGSIFNFNGKPLTVIGITPPGFFGDTLSDSPPDFFLPLAIEPLLQGDNTLLRIPDAHWLDLIGRVRPGATPTSIEAQMRVELKQWLRSHWGEMDSNARANFPRQTLYLSPGGAGITSMREAYEHWLQILMTVSGFVLLIVCANVANLMLVRGIERRQQTSLSIALGARPARLMRQALTESILLSLLGGAAGLAIAFAGTRLILYFTFTTIPGFAGIPIHPSPSMPVLLFAFAVSLLTGVAFGIAPAWMAGRVDPIEALRGVNRSTNRLGSGARKTLVVLQAALSLVLLSASGLLTAALHNLENQNFGFDQDRRTVVNIDPKLAGYRGEQLTALYQRIHDSLAGIPGVAAVALCSYSPQNGDSWNDGVFVDGRAAPGPKENNSSNFDRVTAGYFGVIGNPIIQGRAISEQDTEASQHVAVINEAFARKFFPHENPIGKHFGRSEFGAARQYEVIGVAKDARYLTYNLEYPIGPFFFLPEAQHDVFPNAEYTKGDVRSHFLHEAVILMKPGANLSVSQILRAMIAVDPNMPVYFMRTLREQVASQFSQQRLIARLTSFFGILSLVLASIGLYGVTAYNAGRRTNEIGVRMALGANRSHVVALVLRGAFGLVVFGLLVGLPLTLGIGQFLGHQLYGMSPYNPVVTLAAIVALAFAAFVASLIPAFRASLISPMQALRAE